MRFWEVMTQRRYEKVLVMILVLIMMMKMMMS